MNVAGADDRLHARRMAQQPRDRDGGGGYAVPPGDFVQLPVQFGEFVAAVHVDARRNHRRMGDAELPCECRISIACIPRR